MDLEMGVVGDEAIFEGEGLDDVAGGFPEERTFPKLLMEGCTIRAKRCDALTASQSGRHRE